MESIIARKWAISSSAIEPELPPGLAGQAPAARSSLPRHQRPQSRATALAQQLPLPDNRRRVYVFLQRRGVQNRRAGDAARERQAVHLHHRRRPESRLCAARRLRREPPVHQRHQHPTQRISPRPAPCRRHPQLGRSHGPRRLDTPRSLPRQPVRHRRRHPHPTSPAQATGLPRKESAALSRPRTHGAERQSKPAPATAPSQDKRAASAPGWSPGSCFSGTRSNRFGRTRERRSMRRSRSISRDRGRACGRKGRESRVVERERREAWNLRHGIGLNR